MSNRPPVSAEDFLGGLAGQRVLVTAGAGGIGLCIAETLTALGARVVVCDVSDEALAAVRRRGRRRRSAPTSPPRRDVDAPLRRDRRRPSAASTR